MFYRDNFVFTSFLLIPHLIQKTDSALPFHIYKGKSPESSALTFTFNQEDQQGILTYILNPF